VPGGADATTLPVDPTEKVPTFEAPGEVPASSWYEVPGAGVHARSTVAPVTVAAKSEGPGGFVHAGAMIAISFDGGDGPALVSARTLTWYRPAGASTLSTLAVPADSEATGLAPGLSAASTT
jgi:hypothetical protein